MEVDLIFRIPAMGIVVAVLNQVPSRAGREKALVLTEAGRAYARRVQRGMYEAERTALERTLERFSPEFVDAMDYFADCICEELSRRAPQEGDK